MAFLLIILMNFQLLRSEVLFNDISFPILQWGHKEFPNTTVTLISTNDFYLNRTLPASYKFVYVESPGTTQSIFYKYFETLVNQLVGLGCNGIIVYMTFPQEPGYIIYDSLIKEFSIPVGLVSNSAFEYIKQSEGTVNMTFKDWNKNAWDNVFTGPGYIMFTLILVVGFLINVGLSSYQIFKWIRSKGFGWEIGLVCLIAELITNVLRAISTLLAPVYNVYGIPDVDITVTVAIAIGVIGSILMVFFWLDLTSDPFYHGQFLGLMKRPAFIFIGFCIIFEIICDVVRETVPYSTAQLSTGFYASVKAVIALFYYVAAIRLSKRSKEKNVNQINRRILGSAIATTTSLVFLLIFIATPVSLYPVGWLVVLFGVYFSYCIDSLLLITIFQVPKPRKTIASINMETSSAPPSNSEMNQE